MRYNALSVYRMEQHINEYLHQLFDSVAPYEMPADEKKKADRDPVGYAVEKLTRKKFRRRRLAPATLEGIRKKIEISFDEHRPIHFVVPFGGYKHFWNPSHPEPDWAEVFNFRYLTDFVAPALAVHQPGVIIEYMSEDMILPRMNNYPSEALDRYSEVFSRLIDWYNTKTQDNLQYRFFRVGDKVDKDALVRDVEKLLPERRKAFDTLPEEGKEQELHRSKRSMYWNGKTDLTGLSQEEKEDRMIESRLIELAYYETEAKPEYIGNYLGEDNHICICFSFGTSHDNDEFQDLTLGSTYGSLVDHWIGRGILNVRGERVMPTIVSRNQYEDIKPALKMIAVHDMLPFGNYQHIEMHEQG